MSSKLSLIVPEQQAETQSERSESKVSPDITTSDGSDIARDGLKTTVGQIVPEQEADEQSEPVDVKVPLDSDDSEKKSEPSDLKVSPDTATGDGSFYVWAVARHRIKDSHRLLTTGQQIQRG